MTNSVEPDQTTPVASILKLVSNVRYFFAEDDISRRHSQVHLLSVLSDLHSCSL